MKQSVGERAARSVAVLLVRRVVGYAIRLAVIAVLARKLAISNFGVVAIAVTSINMMTMFGSGGVNTWVIYDREDGWETRVRSAWWLNLFLTAGQVAVAGSLLPVVVWFYNEPLLAPILAIQICTFFIEQMRVVPHALLERQLEFRLIATRDLSYDLFTGIGSIAMALMGWGVWSLVVPRLCLAPIYLMVTFRLASFTPGWNLYRKDWKRILKYSIPVIGSQMLRTVANDGDTLFVGRVLGKAAAGFYNTAYVLANLVGRNVTTVLVQVATPSLAKLRKTGDRDLGPVCIRMYRVIAVVSSPLLAGMFALAHDLVLVVYGNKWLPITPILQIFILFTLCRAITSPAGSVFDVTGRTRMRLVMSIALSVLVVIGVIIGSQFGLLGVTAGVAGARIISGFWAFALSLRVVGASVVAGLRALVPSTLAAGFMGLVVYGARAGLLEVGIGVGIRLGVLVPVGAVVYIVALRLVSPTGFSEMIDVVFKSSPRLKRVFGRLVKSRAQ